MECSFILERWIQLQQHRWLGLLSTILLFTMTGCGTNDENAAQDKGNGGALPIGYYSNEKHDRNGGNARVLEGDNDGPATEIMDHTYGEEANDGKNEITPGKQLFGDDDRNYHGHLARNENPQYDFFRTEIDPDKANQITNIVQDVKNVEAAKTVVYKNHVVIGVRLKGSDRIEETRKNILEAVNPYLNGRNVKLFTNESQYNRIKVINNDLKSSAPKEEQEREIENLMKTNQNVD